MGRSVNRNKRSPPCCAAPANGGARVSLADFRGKNIILYFYPKDNTSGCTKEAIAFTALAKKFEALGVALIGVSKDSAASHDRFKAKHGLKLTLASDPETKVAQSYGVWVEKSMYGRRYMGMERATFLVDAAGKILQVWRKVKVPRHAEVVLAAAKSL